MRLKKCCVSPFSETRFNFAPLLEKMRGAMKSRQTPELEFPTSIAADNKAHPSYTLLQIQTPDRIGLLYDLLSCLGAEGVSIVLSRISTQNGAAIDTFYVTDGQARGKITDPNRIEAIQKRPSPTKRRHCTGPALDRDRFQLADS